MSEWIGALNAFSENWLNSIWRACWQGTIALALVWSIVRLFPKLSPSISCWLWRLAFFKLLVSFVWAKPIELPLLPAKTESNASWSLAPQHMAEKLSSTPSTLAPIDTSVPSVQARSEASTKSFTPSLSLASILFLLWLLGLAFCSALLISGWRTVRSIQSSCKPVGEHEILSECGELCRQFGLRLVARLAKSEQVSSPMLIGVFRPMIVLPSDLLSDCSLSQIRLILAHELAHLKRKDLLWNWLPAIARTLLFFNPLVWLANKEWQLVQEMACDELAILRAKFQPKSYAEILLKVAENCRYKAQKSLVVVGMNESFTALKRRLMAMQFVKPISPTKATVWFVALVSVALVSIVPWRLVAQTGKQTGQTTIQRTGTTVKVPLKRGLELIYEGSVRVIVGGKETQGAIKVNEFVKEVASDGSATVVSLRVFRHSVYGPDASLRFISVRSDGKEVPADKKQITGEVPSKLLSLHFVKVLPVYFVPTQNLKMGSSWVTKEHLPVYQYVYVGEFLPWVEIEMLNRVVKQERVNGVKCWVVRRSLTKPVPIQGGDWAQRLSERNETLWVDAKTGLIQRVEAETILEGQKGKFRHNALQLQLKNQKMLTGNALERRLKELKWVEMMRQNLSHLIVDTQVYKLWETLDGEKIDKAQARVKSLLQDIYLFTNRLFPNSPYIAYWAVQGELLTYLDDALERTEEIAERMGELAPDFELTSVDGEKYRLSELRGKVVLLNFNGMMIRKDEQFPPRQGWIRLFEHLEQIHQKYKDKGVVVLGIWTIYPPERRKEIVEALKVAFPVLIDENGKVSRAYKITSIPTDIVIGKDGRIRFIMGGYTDKRPLVRAIEEAIKR